MLPENQISRSEEFYFGDSSNLMKDEIDPP